MDKRNIIQNLMAMLLVLAGATKELIQSFIAVCKGRRSLIDFKKDCHAFVDVGVGIGIGILFAGLMVIAYIIWTLRDQLITTSSSAQMNRSINNITTGFDNTVLLLLVVVVIWLLALAIMALLVIKKKSQA